MNFELHITKAKNGYYMMWQEEVEREVINHQEVFEEKDGEDEEIECMRRLLLRIKEYFGVYYSKHNQKNLVVEIEGEEKWMTQN